MKNIASLVFIALIVSLLSACAPTVNNSAGRATVYEDVHSTGSVAGVGIESQDIVAVSDTMVRDMMATPVLAGKQIAPYVIIDDAYFTNESSSIINKRMITERLMINLNRAAQGRMVFVERAAANMVEKERMLKRDGLVAQGSMGSARKIAGADYRLTGRIMSLDSIDPRTGRQSRYTAITFKMVDLETGISVWTNMYEFKKASQNDVVYN